MVHCDNSLSWVQNQVRLCLSFFRRCRSWWLRIQLSPQRSRREPGQVPETRTAAENPRTALLASVVRWLGLRVAPGDQAGAYPGPETVVAYHLLRQSLLGTAVEAPDAYIPPRYGRNRLLQWFASLRRAAPVSQAPASIDRFLGEFAAVLSEHSIAEVSSFQPGMSEAQRRAIERYREYSDRLRVSFDDVQAILEGERALVTAWRRDRLEREPGGPLDLRLRLNILLQPV